MHIESNCNECGQHNICKMSNSISKIAAGNADLTGHIEIICGKFVPGFVETCCTSVYSCPPRVEDVYVEVSREKDCDDTCQFAECCTIREDSEKLFNMCDELNRLPHIIAKVTCRFCVPKENK